MSLLGLLIRGRDQWGEGGFHASRDGGSRLHQGVDLAAWPGTPILAPMACKFLRVANPYTDDPRFSGVLLGLGPGTELKVLYCKPVEGLVGAHVPFGGVVAHAQDLREKYKEITPHVHVELWKDGKRVNPSEILKL